LFFQSGLVPLGVIGKDIGGGTEATISGCYNIATVEKDTREVTPITFETGIGEVTPIAVDTLTLTVKTGAWVDCSCVFWTLFYVLDVVALLVFEFVLERAIYGRVLPFLKRIHK